jgi:hypothetical protein
MSGLANVALGVIASVSACTAIASVASIVVAQPEADGRPGLGTANLWTTAPVRVDVKHQRYERLPPVFSTYAMQDRMRLDKGTAFVAAQAAGERSGFSRDHSAQHLNWCSSHYRSFDPSSGTYHSFSGESRPCPSPFVGNVQQRASGISGWCANRYKSYRPEDNSYQPYEGPRQQCTAPRRSQDVASSD